MKKHHILYMALTILTLGGCSSAGSSLANAITDPFTPRPNGKPSLTINSDANDGLLHSNGNTASSIEIDGQTYTNGSSLNIGYLWQNRLSDFTYVLKNGTQKLEEGQLGVYKRSYTAVVGAQVNKEYDPNTGNEISSDKFQIRSIQGEPTLASRLPSGVIRYEGHAFSGLDDRRPDGQPHGRLNYTIDFVNQKGSGSITGLRGFGNINLNESRLSPGQGIVGTASSAGKGQGHYRLNIFGPNGNEIAGKAYDFNGDSNHEVGFAGGRVN